VERSPADSVVIPVNNEQGSIRELQARLIDAFAQLDDPRIKIARLARNVGHRLAITAERSKR
jgi:hypothetical protein